VRLKINKEPAERGAGKSSWCRSITSNRSTTTTGCREHQEGERRHRRQGGPTCTFPDMQQPASTSGPSTTIPQIRKKALIIDVRGNGGGNVSPMIIVTSAP